MELLNTFLKNIFFLASLFIITTQLCFAQNAGTDQGICGTSTTLNATPAAGGVWSTSGNALITNINDPNTTVTNLDFGPNTFTWTVPGPSSDDVIITNNEIVANAGPNADNCGGSSYTLGANNPSPGTGSWSIINSSGVISNTMEYGTTVLGMTSGDNTFRWTINHLGCNSFDDVSIEVYDLYTAFSGSDADICEGTSYPLDGNLPIMGNGLWTSGTAGITIVDPTLYNSNVTGLTFPDIITLTWTITNGPCISYDDVVLKNAKSTISAGSDNLVCNNEYNLSAEDPVVSVGMWSLVGGTGIFDNNTVANTIVRGMGFGTNTFRWSVATNGCAAVNDDVAITNNLVMAMAGPDVDLCEGSSYLLTANTPIPGTGVWTSGTAGVVIVNPSNNNSNVTNLPFPESIVMTWTITNGSCVSSDDIVIHNAIGSANAGLDENTCDNDYVLSAEEPINGIGMWTLISGTGTFDIATIGNTTVRGLSNGSNTFRWTISGGACSSTFDDVTITKDGTILADAGTDVTVCNEFSYFLSANDPSPGTGVWTCNIPSVNFSDPSSPASTATNLPYDDIIFTWTVTDGPCNANDSFTLTNFDNNIYAGANDRICDTQYQLSAANPATGTGIWTVVMGAAVIADNTDANSMVTNLQDGDNRFRWTVSGGACPSNFAEVTVTKDIIIPANAGFNDTTCASTYQLSANDPGAGSGSWSSSDVGISFVDINSNFTQVNNLPVGDTYLTWSVINGACTDDSQIIITRVTEPQPPQIEGPDTVCVNAQGFQYEAQQRPGSAYTWMVTNGSLTSGQNTNQIFVIWGQDNQGASVQINELTRHGCNVSNTIPVFIDNNTPELILKGTGLIICTDSGMVSYRWYSNGTLFENDNKQFFYSENLSGNYHVEVTSPNFCDKASNVLSIDATNLKLYPNPTNSFVNINLNNELTGSITINFRDLTGKLVKTEQLSKSSEIVESSISINELKPGIYKLNVLINNEFRESKTLIIH